MQRLWQRFLALPEALRYLLAGGYNTAFGFGCFALLQWWLGGSVHYLVVLVLNFAISVGNSFLSMKYLVFRSQGPLLRDYLRTNLSYLILLGVNMALLAGLVDGAGMAVIWAQLVCTVLVAGWAIGCISAFRSRASAAGCSCAICRPGRGCWRGIRCR